MTKVFKVTSEGDLEEAVRLFTALAASVKKKKRISFWFPTEALSDIFLQAAYLDFSMRNIEPQPNMNSEIFIEGEPDDSD
jgi:hypothetical protein